ncbi:MAG: DNA polymerase IV [Pseudomonadota bacterium]
MTPPANTPQNSKSLCRDCFSHGRSGLTRCAVCGSRRMIAHGELIGLSIAHIDCDAFFAAIEKRDAPELADRPVIVGGGKRGVVSTACYVARTYGVKSAMPMFKALKACPHAVVVRPNFEKYIEASRAIRAIMEAATPLVQPLSIDEAFLDLSGTERLHGGPPAETLAKIAAEVERKVGVTVSIGLSHNKFLAKVASDLDKPRGFSVIGKAETLSFLADKPVSFIWGVGKSFSARLEKDGLYTLGQIQRMETKALADRYGAMGLRLSKLSHGEDARTVHAPEPMKSVSAETTFNEDLRAVAALEDRLWPLCEKVSKRAKAKNIAGRVVTLKLKTANFRILTRRESLDRPTNLARALFKSARELLKAAAGAEAYRLIGVGISDLTPAGETAQHDLFAHGDEKTENVERAVDAIRAKFGDAAISAGRVLGKTTR